MPTIPIFVSSTFRDFHAERDLLATELRELLDAQVAPYGCRVEVIDLRWGVDTTTEEDEQAAQRMVLSVCLSEIDRCRPLFLGLIGDRYGWVPPPSLLSRAARAQGLDPDPMDSWSVTALEFEWGAFSHPQVAPVFLARTIHGPVPDGWADADRARVADLRRRVEQRGARVVDYTAASDGTRLVDLDRFRDAALEVLTPAVVSRALDHAGEALDPYTAAERLFVEDRRRVFAGRDALCEDLGARLSTPGRRICLTGPSGSGKSAVWCALVEQLQQQGHQVWSHVVGVARSSSSPQSIVARMSGLAGVAPPPAELADLDALLDWFHGVAGQAGPVVVAIDGLDGLDQSEEFERLRLLVGLDPGVTVLCTTNDARQARALGLAGMEVLDVPALSPSEVARTAAMRASAVGRHLPAAVVEHFSVAARSPLWVRLAVGELIALDEEDFATVDRDLPPDVALNALLARTAAGFSDDVDALVVQVVHRAEERLGGELVAAALGVLALSRSGLTPSVLAGLVGCDDLSIAALRRAMAGMVAERGASGRLGFTHDVARRAVLQRYRPDRVATHGLIAAHLAGLTPPDDVDQQDLLWHALHAGRVEVIVGALDEADDDPEVYAWVSDVLADAAASGHVDTEIARIAQAPTLGPAGVDALTAVVDDRGRTVGWRARLLLATTALAASRRVGDADDLDAWTLAGALRNAAAATRMAGKYRRAVDLWTEAVEVLRRLEAAHPEETAVGEDLVLTLEDMGAVLLELREADRARAVLEEVIVRCRQLSRSAPDQGMWPRTLARTLQLVAADAIAAGEVSRAEAVVGEALAIRRRLASGASDDDPDLNALATAIQMMSYVCQQRGRRTQMARLADEALATRRRVVAAAPGDTNVLAELSRDLDLVASSEANAGRHRQALHLAGESLSVQRRLAAQDPDNPERQRQLADRLARMSAHAIDCQQVDQALALGREAITARRAVIAGCPDDIDAVDRLATLLTYHGANLMSVGQSADAHAILEEAVAHGREVVARTDGAAGALSTLASHLETLAAAERRAHLWADFDRHTREAIALWRRVLAVDDTSARRRLELATSLRLRATGAMEAGRSRDAAALLDEAIHLLRSVRDEIGWQATTALAGALHDRCDVYEEDRQWAQALATADEVLRLRREAVVGEDDVDGQLILSRTLVWYPVLHLVAGRPVHHEPFVAEAMEITMPLRAGDPRSPTYLDAHVFVLACAAGLHLDTDDERGAVALLTAAVTHLESFAPGGTPRQVLEPRTQDALQRALGATRTGHPDTGQVVRRLQKRLNDLEVG